MQQGFIPVHAVQWLNVMLYTYLPPTTSASTCWNQFGGGCLDCLANCCTVWENRQNQTPTYCSAMESWYGVMSVAMVIGKSHAALAILIYFSHSHLLTIVPLALSIYGMVDSEICVQHNCHTMPLFWHVTAFLTGKLIGKPRFVVLQHIGI